MMMEENQTVSKNSNSSRIESIKHYCRVCTSNPKTKRTHPEENIRIFSRTGLLSILQKFLHLEVSEDDPLPKTICKKCFEKLMAIEYLQIVAKRSESLFKDFLANRCTKPVAKTQSSAKTDFNIKPAPINIEKKPEEVIVDVSMSDPLTKDIKKKLQVAQSKRDSIGLAFTPDHISKNAVTSSPLTQVPVTIVHRMPKKRKITPNPLEKNQIVQIPLPHPHPSLQPQKSSTTTVTLENPPKKQFSLLKPKANPTSPLRHISEAPSIPQNVEIHPVVSGNPQVMGHGMPLGSIIKDVDLLKLILKALKWPFNNQTLDLQIQRLKNTNFNDIIVDPNLLQDTDLIQILGPLIAPLPVTMRQQTYHITIPPETLETPPTTMSYKLPAETSVQIITVPATEKESSHGKDRPTKRHNKSSSMRKKSSLVPRPRLSSQVIVVSDDSEDNRPLQIAATTNDDIPNFGVQLDPAVYPGVGENSNSNEAMLATLNRQREAMMRMHRSKRKQSLNCAKNVEMVDDIMIVDEGFHMEEAYPVVLQSNKNLEMEDMLPVASTSQRKSAPNKNFAPLESVKSDIAFPQIKTQPTPRSKSLTSMKPVRCLTEHLKPEKVPPIHGFAKLKEDSSLPPLKRVKLLPKSAGQIQVKEPSKLVYMSKNTTVADADSTTKIVTKESKSPKPTKPLWNFSKISKAKRAAQAHRSESIEQRSSSAKNQGTEKNEKSDKDVIVLVACEDECAEKQKKTPEVVATSKKKKNLKNPTPIRSEKRKNDYKVLATFDVSDEEMEPLQVSDTSAKHSVEEKTTPPVEEEEASKTETNESPTADCVEETVEAVNDLPNVAAKEPNPTEIDPLAEKDKDTDPINVPEIAIKAENNESIDIKKEDLESTYEGQAVKLEPTTKSASKMAIKSEIAKSTRSSGKRKAIQKEEEPPIETMNFRPARKSKTLSKYYKGPPLSGTPGRCMRSRT
ncbi:uncharacterized protein LOC129950319 [Eupeodes corollae]|uniref:uncharacterized protein LOC129950319 n=1 Tax=Eupeodes corollae TaxID=290404 RepID=UPI002493B396|nr:uncharacterized protein LOC129950319 [Eupeodes corollae]